MPLQGLKKLDETFHRPHFLLASTSGMEEDGFRLLLVCQALFSVEPLPPALIRRCQIQFRVLTLYREMVPAKFPEQMVYHVNSLVPRRKEVEMDHPAFTDSMEVGQDRSLFVLPEGNDQIKRPEELGETGIQLSPANEERGHSF